MPLSTEGAFGFATRRRSPHRRMQFICGDYRDVCGNFPTTPPPSLLLRRRVQATRNTTLRCHTQHNTPPDAAYNFLLIITRAPRNTQRDRGIYYCFWVVLGKNGGGLGFHSRPGMNKSSLEGVVQKLKKSSEKVTDPAKRQVAQHNRDVVATNGGIWS